MINLSLSSFLFILCVSCFWFPVVVWWSFLQGVLNMFEEVAGKGRGGIVAA